ncbi:Uncharacterised protein [Vibrio cholerae]|nr:Uncharacterised protein [Vibrio cholerae]
MDAINQFITHVLPIWFYLVLCRFSYELGLCVFSALWSFSVCYGLHCLDGASLLPVVSTLISLVICHRHL